MANFGRFYSVFEKQKLDEVLSIVLNKKVDYSWVGLGGSAISSSAALFTTLDKLASLPANNSGVLSNFLSVASFVFFIIAATSIYFFLKGFRKYWSNRKYTAEIANNEIHSAEIEQDHNYVFIIKSTQDNTPRMLFLKKTKKWLFLTLHNTRPCIYRG